MILSPMQPLVKTRALKLRVSRLSVGLSLRAVSTRLSLPHRTRVTNGSLIIFQLRIPRASLLRSGKDEMARRVYSKCNDPDIRF
jgi:hypothetical protein